MPHNPLQGEAEEARERRSVDEVRVFLAKTSDGGIMLDVKIVFDDGSHQDAARLVPPAEIIAYGAPQRQLKAQLKVDVG